MNIETVEYPIEIQRYLRLCGENVIYSVYLCVKSLCVFNDLYIGILRMICN